MKRTSTHWGAIVALAATMVAGPALADPVTYSVTGDYANVTLGTRSFNNCSGASIASCAVVTITATSDTKNVVPFSITSTSNGVTSTTTGYENSVLSHITVSIKDPVTAVTYTANILPTAQLFFGDDQTNGGVGFGSRLSTPAGVPYGPTYPLSLYDNAFYNGGIDLFKTYDLKTTLQNAFGFSSFCPTGTACDVGPPIPTDQGDLSITFPLRPSFSALNVTVTPPPPPKPRPPPCPPPRPGPGPNPLVRCVPL